MDDQPALDRLTDTQRLELNSLLASFAMEGAIFNEASKVITARFLLDELTFEETVQLLDETGTEDVATPTATAGDMSGMPKSARRLTEIDKIRTAAFPPTDKPAPTPSLEDLERPTHLRRNSARRSDTPCTLEL